MYKPSEEADVGDFILVTNSLYEFDTAYYKPPKNGSVGRVIRLDDADDYQTWLAHFPQIGTEDNNPAGTWWMAAKEFVVLNPESDLCAGYMLEVMKK